MTEKEELFLKWFNDNRESMHVNLSTVGGLRSAFFGGLEAAEKIMQWVGLEPGIHKVQCEYCCEITEFEVPNRPKTEG